jgi:hypothetical protein
VERQQDMKTLRRILHAYSSDLKDYRRIKGYGLNSEIDALITRFHTMKQTERNRDGDPLYAKGKMMAAEKQRITSCLTTLCTTRKFNEEITVGGPHRGTAEYIKAKRYGKPDVKMCVGWLWHRNVWEKMYKDGRFLNKDYIILSATEYKVNVPHIRLYEVSTYGIAEKQTVMGWIGQSKLGKQLCAFRLDRKLAISVAQSLAVTAINETLKGEVQNG